MANYAIIRLGGKQYRVQEGERLLVDRLKTDAGASFTPDVLFVGGDGDANATVTAKVLEHVLGEKIRIGKYRPKQGYKRHTGFRASLSRIQIEAIGDAKSSRSKKAADEPKKEQEAPKAQATPKAHAAPAAAEEPAPTRTSHPPKGYEEMTIADIKEGVGSWRRPQLEAALEYEREHGNRKGAIAVLESALAEKEGA